MSFWRMNREEKRKHLQEFAAKHGYSYQHMLDLDDEFPEVEMFGPQCVSAEVGAGWAPLLRPPLQALKALGGKLAQVKQKFGGLRIYWNPPDELHAQYREWYDSGKNGPDPLESNPLYVAVKTAVFDAETQSWRTCERCGKDLGVPKAPSHRTLCAECEGKR